jgi:DNA repair protein RecO (recombination protein O)
MALLKTPAITLKSRRWGEADRIVTFYTLRFGKLRGVARGARRLKSRFGSALEPFVYCDLNVFERGNDSLYRVTQADILENHAALREDLTLMAVSARLVNLVDAVTAEGDPGPKIFTMLLAGLRTLPASSDPYLTVLLFQIRLLGYTGFRPQTDHCAACGQSGKLDGLQFSAVSGGVVCSQCANRRPDRCVPMSPGGLACLQQALQLPIPVLPRLKADGQVRHELERAVEAYVTVVAGKRLPPVDFLAAEGRSPAYGSRS